MLTKQVVSFLRYVLYILFLRLDI